MNWIERNYERNRRKCIKNGHLLSAGEQIHFSNEKRALIIKP
jgi:hypothetical protein